MSKFKLLLFDLDGTIVNSMYDIGDAMNFTLRKFGKKEITYAQVPALVGSGLRQLLGDTFGQDMDIDQVHQIFMNYYTAHHTDKTRPYDQVESVLSQLPNIKKGIYSNKAHHLTNSIIDKLALKKYFSYVQGARPELYHSKPSPEGISFALNALNIAPEDTLFIGDSTHDVLAGKRADTKTCAVTYGYRPKEVLLAEKPDYIIDRFDELLDIVTV